MLLAILSNHKTHHIYLNFAVRFTKSEHGLTQRELDNMNVSYSQEGFHK